MMLVEETVPGREALPVAALRAHLRLGSGFELAAGAEAEEDRALEGFLRAAMAAIEARTGKVLLTRRYRMQIADWRDRLGQALPLAPVQAIDSVSIEDAAGVATTLMAADYRLIADMQRPVLSPVGAMLPSVPQRGFATVRFTAGFGESWDEVPADLAQAVIMLAARYYEDRAQDSAAAALPFGVSALIERWRAVRVLAGRGAR